MAEKFYSLLTKVGKAKIANSIGFGTKINFTKMKVGDGGGTYYEPTEEQTDLKNTVWEGNINHVEIDEDNSNWIHIELMIPATVGGFTIREYGAFDDEGNLIGICKCAETYKPVITDGSTKELLLDLILCVINTENITLKIDPTIIFAKKSEVDILNNNFSDFKKSVESQLSDMATKTTSEISNLQSQANTLKETIDNVDLNADKVALNSSNFKSKNVKDGLEELFINAGNVKNGLKDAVTGLDKKINLPPNPTFEDIINSIKNIKTGVSCAKGTFSENVKDGVTMFISGLDFTPYCIYLENWNDIWIYPDSHLRGRNAIEVYTNSSGFSMRNTNRYGIELKDTVWKAWGEIY